MNRETYLEAATDRLGEEIFKPQGLILPDSVKVSVGYPSKGGTRSKNKTIGQCFSTLASDNEVNEIFIHPELDDPVKVLGVLIHELIHAIDNCENGHRAVFRRMALAVGLTGKMTATTESPELVERLETIVKGLGAYPHAKLQTPNPKQGTRLLKVECLSCGFLVRASKKQVERLTEDCPCPCCEDRGSFGNRD